MLSLFTVVNICEASIKLVSFYTLIMLFSYVATVTLGLILSSGFSWYWNKSFKLPPNERFRYRFDWFVLAFDLLDFSFSSFWIAPSCELICSASFSVYNWFFVFKSKGGSSTFCFSILSNSLCFPGVSFWCKC